MHKKPQGTLIIIGGHEDKEDHRAILQEVTRRAKRKSLVIVTAATEEPEEYVRQYTAVFKDLGVKEVDAVDIREREDAQNEENVELIKRAGVVFFTGGDQLRITSQIGDSQMFQTMRDSYHDGCTIVGTSAGAAAMSETMLISGSSDKSMTIGDLNMAPGLGFVGGVVIDSHFAERGRIGRLISAVTQNPRNLGIGIDEDTAIIVEHGDRFRVIGSGAVYVVDGTGIERSNLSEEADTDHILSVTGAKLHVLAEGDKFDLVERKPSLDLEEIEHLDGHKSSGS